MENNPRHLMLHSAQLALPQQTLLADIAAESTSANMPSYLVGGFVRDLLLKKTIHDLDIIIEGNAIKFGNLLVKKYGGKLTTHPKFHTAIWHLKPDTATPDTLDLITARAETYPHAGALPTVKPATIQDDLRRRDFTINAMAIRLDGENFGELLDPLNGQADLTQGIIRVLHPHSFIDDPTRIFRAVRYEQRYGFNIEPETLNLINTESLAILAQLSGERIRHEFDLIFEEESAALILIRLKNLGILSVFNLPEFDQSYSNLLKSTPSVEFNLAPNSISLGYLLWLINVPASLITVLSQRLSFTAELSAALIALIKLKEDLPAFKNVQPSAWTFHLENHPLISIYALWLVTQESALKDFLVKWRHIKSITTGADLKTRGIPPSPRYKEILTQLRAAWLDGEVDNAEEEERLLATLL